MLYRYVKMLEGWDYLKYLSFKFDRITSYPISVWALESTCEFSKYSHTYFQGPFKNPNKIMSSTRFSLQPFKVLGATSITRWKNCVKMVVFSWMGGIRAYIVKGVKIAKTQKKCTLFKQLREGLCEKGYIRHLPWKTRV